MAGNLVRPKNVTDAQWQQAVELYNAAKRKGDRYPELTVAQAALETGWFKSPSGKYNYFGQKAKASEKASTLSTREVSQGREYTTSARFKDYNSIDEAVADRVKKWGSKYKDASTIDQAIGSIWQYDPKTGSGKGYATDSNYGYKLKTILNSMGVSSSQSNNPVAVEEEQETSTYKPYVSYLQENAGTIETAGKYSEPKEVTEAKKEIYQAQQEENFLEALSNLQQQPQQEVPQQEQSYLENPELFQLAQVPQIQYEQFQDGGVIEEDKKWLENWYNNRVIPDKEIQEVYLKDKPYFTQRIKEIPSVKNVDIIDNDPFRQGRYDGNKNTIEISKTAEPSTYLHEANHSINSFPSYMRAVHENVVDKNIYKKGDPRLGVNNKIYDYLRDPDEIHSRVQVLRKDAGFRPDEEITEDRLYNYLQNYKGSDFNILQLMNLTDVNGLLDMLNYMAYNPKKNSAKENYAESGGIIKDNNGYWNPNNWGKTVEISSPSITMKGVKQPLVGYAPETGETKIMLPGEDYFFNGANRVIESQLIK